MGRLKIFILENLDWNIDLNPIEMSIGVHRDAEKMPLLFNLLCLIVQINISMIVNVGNRRYNERGLIWKIIYVRNIEYDIAQKKAKALF